MKKLLQAIKTIWHYRIALAPTIALIAMLWLTGYAFLFRFWTSIIMVEPPNPIHIIHTAKANTAAMSTEEYICFVFGAKECPTALAIAQAESGLRCDAQNVNKGTNSLDLGVMQINSVHLKKGWKVADLLNCHKNIDLAFEIYQGSGWNAWTTYTNKSYKRFLN